MIFQSSILSLHFFTSNFNYEKAISSSNNSPLSGSGSNLDYIEMNYCIEYEIVKNGAKSKDSIPLKLIVNGTEDIYENGTISYYVGKNVTDKTVLQLLSNVFIDSQMNFFKNHSIEEFYQTFFSYRREALSNNISAFLTNASYSLFWINTTGNKEGYLSLYRSIPFLDVEDPFFLGINDENRIISDKTWSDEKSELSKNVRILNSFYLKANFNDEQIINLYYDKTWTILLKGTFENYDTTGDRYILDIILVDTNLNLDFLPDNPFWDVRLRNLLIFIPLSSVAGVIITITFIKNLEIKKRKIFLIKFNIMW